MFDGYGTYKWLDGSVFEGNWKADKRNGEGIMRYSDGHIEK